MFLDPTRSPIYQMYLENLPTSEPHCFSFHQLPCHKTKTIVLRSLSWCKFDILFIFHILHELMWSETSIHKTFLLILGYWFLWPSAGNCRMWSRSNLMAITKIAPSLSAQWSHFNRSYPWALSERARKTAITWSRSQPPFSRGRSYLKFDPFKSVDITIVKILIISLAS